MGWLVQYVDYVGSWGPAIVGHAHPEVTEALTEQIKKVQYPRIQVMKRFMQSSSASLAVCETVKVLDYTSNTLLSLQHKQQYSTE